MEESSSSSSEDILLYIDLIPEQRVFRNRTNMFDIYNDREFQQRFRLSKETVQQLLEVLGDNFAPATNRNRSISSANQLLCTLRFLATGTYQNVIGDIVGIHKTTVCRIIKKVLRAIAGLSPVKIILPATAEEIVTMKQQYFEKYGFPNVIGCVDGTHIKIQSPGGDNSERYRNRKGFFSYNVQAMCDSQLRIRNIDARWPGSTHDSTIFNASLLKIRMEDFENCFLLGDSAYPCKKYLMTPLINPHNEAEIRYNRAHINTRNCIERCFGILKRRFPALALGMRVKNETSLVAIVAAAVLHNIAIDENNDLPDPENPVLDEDNEDPAIFLHDNDGFEVRRQLIRDYFN